MSFLQNIFKPKEDPIRSYADFWKWFQKNEKDFFKAVKSGEKIESKFFDKLSPKLGEIKEGYFYVTGMYDNSTAELILTAEGNPNHIFFVEELVKAAPDIAGWKFTALKPALSIEQVNIKMYGYDFTGDNLFFYANAPEGFPDEIDITVLHPDILEENKKQIANGIFIFLDNFLGELNLLEQVDNIKVIGTKEAESDLIPIAKLKEYLHWRQKEFIEKYEGIRHNTEQDGHTSFEAENQEGNALMAIINTDLLQWDGKASHPWVGVLTLEYDGTQNNGMPDEKDYNELDKIEKDLNAVLKDSDGCLKIGRQTGNGEREIYFACNDYRKSSKVFFEIQKQYSGQFTIEYDIFKNKYWQTFERFNP